MTASPLTAYITVQQEEMGTTLPFSETGRNQELSPCSGTYQGVGSMTAPSMEHGAKPPVSFLPTPCFLPMNRLRLRALDVISCSFPPPLPFCLANEGRKQCV
jgi:hypothetical protein